MTQALVALFVALGLIALQAQGGGDRQPDGWALFYSTGATLTVNELGQPVAAFPPTAGTASTC
jgi:hypothetical protein